MFSIKKISRSGNKLPILSSVVIAMLLCLSGVFIIANTDSGSDATINATDGLDYTVTDGCLTISGTGAMQDYTSSANLHTLYTFTTCIIESGVTSIGVDAFYNCTGLASITISDSVTTIGADAFFACTSLPSIVIPDSVTTIGTGAFNYCESLESIILPDSVTTIGNNLCQGCTSLASVTLSDSLTSISQQAFDGCTGLTSITIPASVTNFGGGAFDGCTNLTNMYCVGSSGSITFVSDVPNTCTITYDYVESATFTVSFEFGSTSQPACESQTVPAGSCATDPNVVIDGYSVAWYSDSGLTIPFDFDSAISENTIIYIGLTAIPDDLDYAVADGCLTISGTGVMQIYTPLVNLGTLYTFTSCVIESGVTSIGVDAFSGCTGLINVVIPNSVTSIGDGAFSGCTGLTAVVIPDSVTSIGINAFGSCSNLITINIPDSVTSIRASAFVGCTNLTNMFCEGSLGSITFGDGAVPDTCMITYDVPSATSDGSNSNGIDTILIAGAILLIVGILVLICMILTGFPPMNPIVIIVDLAVIAAGAILICLGV